MANPMALPQYDAMRRRAQGQISQQRGQGDDALKRRFAMNGMSGSGAFQKAAQIADDSNNRLQAETMQDIDAQEAGALLQRQDVQEGRQFQTAERTGAERFAAEEAAKGRTFQTGERLGSQQFQTGERMGGQDWQQRQLDFQNNMATKEFDMNEYNNYLNALIAMKDADFDFENLGQTQGWLTKMGYKLPQGGNVFTRRG